MRIRFGVDAPIYEVKDKGKFALALNSHFCTAPFSGVDLPCLVLSLRISPVLAVLNSGTGLRGWRFGPYFSLKAMFLQPGWPLPIFNGG